MPSQHQPATVVDEINHDIDLHTSSLSAALDRSQSVFVVCCAFHLFAHVFTYYHGDKHIYNS